ncbi:MAG: hypothetical protein M3P93_14930 [Actinomycetota bacterium]|nr:hypothetical protein [Actinomycetota bacterium]
MSWWWCLEHGRVEEGEGCANDRRLGPYESEEQAAGALDRARARTAANDAQDEAEDAWPDDRGSGRHG